MRILTITDFSNASREACTIAAEISRSLSAALVVAAVIEPLRDDQAVSFPRDPFAARSALGCLYNGRSTPDVDVTTEVLVGSFDEAIAAYVEAHAVDLVVLHERLRPYDARLAEHSGCPVMILGDETSGMRAEVIGSHRLRVLVAVDPSETRNAPTFA